MNRALVFILGMLFGIIFLFAALGIGAYVAVTVITPNTFTDEFDNVLGTFSDMSLLDIYNEIVNLYATKNIALPDENGNYYTLGDFVDEYNVDLTDVFGFEITDELLEIPLFSLLAEDGIDIVLDNTKVSAILSVLSTITLPDYLISAVGGASLSELISDPVTLLLSGIFVGGLLNNSVYELTDSELADYDTILYSADGTTALVKASTTEEGTTYAILFDDSWCIASLSSDIDADELDYTEDDFSVIWYSSTGEEASGMYQSLGSYTLDALMNSDDIFGELMGALTLGDIMGDSLDGTMLGNLANCSIDDLANEIDNMQIATLLGYENGDGVTLDTLGYVSDPELWYTVTIDNDGNTIYEEASGMQGALAGLTISDLSGDIMGELEEVSIGTLLGYTQKLPATTDDSDDQAQLQTTSIKTTNYTTDSDIADDATDTSTESDSELENTEKDSKWYVYDESTNEYTEVTGLNAVLANLTMGDLQGDNIMDTIGDTKLGLILDYTEGSADLEGTQEGKWYTYDEDTDSYTEVAGLDSVLAGLVLNDLTDGDIMTTIGDTKLGIMLDYTEGSADLEGTQEGKWYTYDQETESYTEIAGLDAVLADLDLNALSDGDIMGAIGDTEVGVMLNYTKVYTCDIDSDHIHDEDCQDECAEHEHTGDCYYWITETGENVSGLDAVIADLTLNDLQSGDIMGLIGDTKLGVMLDYTEGSADLEGTEEGKWYTYDQDSDTYTEIGGLDSVLADLELDDLMGGDIMGAIGDTEIGIMLNYTKVYTCDIDSDHIHDECTLTCTDPDCEHTDGCYDCGEHEHTSDCYYWITETGETVSGLDSVIATLTLNDLQGGDIMGLIGDTEVGVMLDYTLGSEIDLDALDDDTWYIVSTTDNLDGTATTEYTPISGIDAVIADMTLSQLQDGDMMGSMDDTMVGVMLGYTQVWTCDGECANEECSADNGCYYWATSDETAGIVTIVTDESGNITSTDTTTATYTKVGGMDSVIADLTIGQLMNGNLMDEISDTKLGVMLDYTWGGDIDCEDTDSNIWYTISTSTDEQGNTTTVYTPVSGMDEVLAEMTLGDLQGGDIMGSMDDAKVGVMLGYTQVWTCDGECANEECNVDNGCYYWATSTETAGIMTIVTDESGNITSTDTTTATYTKIGGMDSVIAELTIDELMSGNIMDLISDTKLGVMLDYTMGADIDCDGIDDNTWYTATTTDNLDGSTTTVYTPVSGMDEALAEMTLGDLQSGDIMGAMEDNNVMVGVMLGYTQVWICGGDCDNDECSANNGCYYWATTENDAVAGVVTVDTDRDGNTTTTVSPDPTYTEVGGMDSVIADLTIGKLMNGNIMDEISDTKVGIILDYVQELTCTDEGCEHTDDCYTWYTVDESGNKTEVSALDAKIASLTLSQLQDGDLLSQINDLTLAELFGYVEGDGNNNTEVGKWYTYDEDKATYTEVDAVMGALADSKLKDLQNGDIIDALDDVLLGDLLGYTKGDGVTLDANDVATDTDKWYTTNADDKLEEATGLEAKLAEKTLSNLQDGGIADIVDTLTLEDVLGDDANEGVFASIGGDTMIGDLNDAIEGMLLGDLLNLTIGDDTNNGTNGVWYNDEACTTETTGVMKTLASLTIKQLQDGNTLNDTINNMALGDILTINDNSSALLLSLKDTALGEIPDAIDSMEMGIIMGLVRGDGTTLDSEGVTTDEDLWYEIVDKVWTKVEAGTVGAVAGDGVAIDSDGNITSADSWYIVTTDVWTEADSLTQSISDLTAGTMNADSIYNIVQSLTMGDMMECGLISLTDDNIDTLDDLFTGSETNWRDMKLSNFLSSLLNAVDLLMNPSWP